MCQLRLTVPAVDSLVYYHENTGNRNRDYRVNFMKLQKIDELQKEANQMLYRYISFSKEADALSIYQIVEVSQNSVLLQYVQGISDDGMQFCPETMILPKEKALMLLQKRDSQQHAFKTVQN